MSEVAIRFNNVSKYYKLYDSPKDRLKEALRPGNKKYHREFYALKDINLEVKKGEILGVVGRNGSGKSTLLKLLAGVLVPNKGIVSVQGKISALLELGSGFNPNFTGFQNIYFYGTILGFSKKEMDERLDSIVGFADIGNFINQPLKTYSSGMKAKLGFSVAVHIDPEVLILDEVLSVGDVFFQRKCYAKMEEFFKGGKTILYVSHNSNSVNELCSRAILLDEGEILLKGAPKDVTSWYQKYTFASGENKANIRAQMADLNLNNDMCVDAGTVNEKSVRKSPVTSRFYAADLVAKDTIKVQNLDRNVDIFDPCIVNDAGENNNILVFNSNYTLRFKLKLGMQVKNLSYGIQIKDQKGVVISNASLKGSGDFITVLNKGLYHVSCRFSCKILPGYYFVDTSVTGVIDKEREVLCRKLDHYLFKVITDDKIMYRGKVSLDQRLSHVRLDDEANHSSL